MRPVSSDEMRRLDRAAIEDFQIPALQLMENAGRGVSDLIACERRPCRVAVFAGTGNNGGDGFVTARHLSNRGFQVRVFLLADPGRLKSDSLTHYRALEKMKIPVLTPGEGFPAVEFSRIVADADLVVDAIFGIGLKRDLSGIFGTAVRTINDGGRCVVSIDVPSGLDADSGEVLGAAVRADITATLALPKTGLFRGDGPAHAGKIEIVDIGIPRTLLLPYLD